MAGTLQPLLAVGRDDAAALFSVWHPAQATNLLLLTVCRLYFSYTVTSSTRRASHVATQRRRAFAPCTAQVLIWYSSTYYYHVSMFGRVRVELYWIVRIRTYKKYVVHIVDPNWNKSSNNNNNKSLKTHVSQRATFHRVRSRQHHFCHRADDATIPD